MVYNDLQVGCQTANCTKQCSVVQSMYFSPQSVQFRIVWCVVYIHFEAGSLSLQGARIKGGNGETAETEWEVSRKKLR